MNWAVGTGVITGTTEKHLYHKVQLLGKKQQQ